MMGEKTQDLIKHWHNKGQADYPDFNPPDKPTLFEFVEGNSDVEIAISKAYRAGYRNTKKLQKS